jgi:hypothetical protein
VLSRLIEEASRQGVSVVFLETFIDGFVLLPDKTAGRTVLTCRQVISRDARRRAACGAHRYRRGRGGNNPPHRRPRDRAAAWRCDVEKAKAKARRLHWWEAPGGVIEFVSVTFHDDPNPMRF